MRCSYGDGTARLTVEENIIFPNVPADKLEAMQQELVFRKYPIHAGGLACFVCWGPCFVVWRARVGWGRVRRWGLKGHWSGEGCSGRTGVASTGSWRCTGRPVLARQPSVWF